MYSSASAHEVALTVSTMEHAGPGGGGEGGSQVGHPSPLGPEAIDGADAAWQYVHHRNRHQLVAQPVLHVVSAVRRTAIHCGGLRAVRVRQPRLQRSVHQELYELAPGDLQP